MSRNRNNKTQSDVKLEMETLGIHIGNLETRPPN